MAHRITRRRILLIIGIFIAIGWARYIKEDDGYTRDDLENVAIIEVPYKTLPAYSCNAIVTIAEQNEVNTKETILSKSECFEAFENGTLVIRGHTCYNVTRNATSSHHFIEKEGNVPIILNITITLREFTANYDEIRERVILPSGFSNCYYKNFVCYDPLHRITAFWYKYEADCGDGVSLLYYGSAELYSFKAIPDRKSVVIRDKSGSSILHLQNNNLTLCKKLDVIETNIETFFLSFEEDQALSNFMDPLSKKIDPLKVLTFKDILNVYEEIERYWANKSLPEENVTQSQHDDSKDNEGTPVTTKEIEKPEFQETTPNRVEENIEDTTSDQVTTTNTAEENISDRSSHQEPKEPRDNSGRTKECSSMYSYIEAICLLVFIIIIVSLLAFYFRIRQRVQVVPEETRILEPEN